MPELLSLIYPLPGVFSGDANLPLDHLNTMTSSSDKVMEETCAYCVEKIAKHNFQNQP